MIKWGILFGCVLLTFNACGVRKNKAGVAPTHDITLEESEITNVIHGFFKWYEKEQAALSAFDFVDTSETYRRLNHDALNKYFAHLLASGYISKSLIDSEIAFYIRCESFWKNQAADEVPICLAGDRFYCAFDYIAPYYSGEVKSIIDGEEAVATLTLTGDFNEQRILIFNLKKENNQWLLSGLGCNMHEH
jgi:hypothetical protein